MSLISSCDAAASGELVKRTIDSGVAHCSSVLLASSNICRRIHITHIFRFLLNWPIFSELLQVRPVPKNKQFGITVAKLLQAKRPSCHLTKSIKTLFKDVGINTSHIIRVNFTYSFTNDCNNVFSSCKHKLKYYY